MAGRSLEPQRPDPGRDEGGSWAFVVLFLAVAVAVTAWGLWLFWQAS
jgi:hypothetical protein